MKSHKKKKLLVIYVPIHVRICQTKKITFTTYTLQIPTIIDFILPSQTFSIFLQLLYTVSKDIDLNQLSRFFNHKHLFRTVQQWLTQNSLSQTPKCFYSLSTLCQHILTITYTNSMYTKSISIVSTAII